MSTVTQMSPEASPRVPGGDSVLPPLDLDLPSLFPLQGSPRMRNLLLAVLLTCGKCPAVPDQAGIHLQTLGLGAQLRCLFKSGSSSPVLRVELLQSWRAL